MGEETQLVVLMGVNQSKLFIRYLFFTKIKFTPHFCKIGSGALKNK